MSKYREESHKQWKEQYFRMRQEKSTYHFEKESSMRESFYSKPEVEVFEQNCSIFIQVKKKKDGKRTLFVLDCYFY